MENDEVQLTEETAEPSGQELLASEHLALIEMLIESRLMGDRDTVRRELALRAGNIRRNVRAAEKSMEHAANTWARAQARVRRRRL